jgi:hypothetical protein
MPETKKAKQQAVGMFFKKSVIEFGPSVILSYRIQPVAAPILPLNNESNAFMPNCWSGGASCQRTEQRACHIRGNQKDSKAQKPKRGDLKFGSDITENG